MEFTKKELLSLAVPLMAEQLLNSLMGTADSMMVASAGNAAISAVSLVDSINVLAVNVFSAMATGGAIVASQKIGAGKIGKAQSSARQLLVSVCAVSLLAAFLCAVFRRPLLSAVFGKVDSEVMEGALEYFFITALSYPLIASYNALAAISRASGDSRRPLFVSTASNALNIAGNAVTIFALGMGVRGAAISTFLSRLFSAICIFFLIRFRPKKIGISGILKTKPNFREISEIMKIGIPTGIENGMFQFGKLAIQSTVSLMGTTAIAANAVTSSLESLSCQAPIGIGLSMMTVVGQSIGSGDKKCAESLVCRLTLWGFFALLVSAAFVSALVFPLTHFSGMERDAAILACRLTWFVHAIKPFAWGLSFLPAYGFRAAGDAKFPMLVSMVTMWTCRVLAVTILARVFGIGPLAVWIGMALDWCVRSCLFALRLRSEKWLHEIG